MTSITESVYRYMYTCHYRCNALDSLRHKFKRTSYLFKWKMSNCEVMVIDGVSVASVNYLQLQCVWAGCKLIV